MQSLANFRSVIMHICISDITAVFEFTLKWWLHHQSELGGDSATLRLRVVWCRRKKSVKFRHHQTSYHSHVLIVVNTKSNSLFKFTSHKT